MSIGLIIIQSIIIAIVIMPFALFLGGNKKKVAELRKALEAEATQNNCKFHKVEVHGNFAIGIDTTNQKLFFYRKNKSGAYAKVVDLKSVSFCKPIKETKRVKDKSKHYDVIEKIGLAFFNNNHNRVISIEFFNYDEMILNDELVVAEEWHKFLNEVLTPKEDVKTVEKQKELTVAVS
ncbi:hypothetical protein [uncultured Winogradskyella sp.]|uniref:hypothetical protein n=1 Tax=uncultured Winogradskyella sp. TaxID=395353 RepID=UPI0030EC509A|tara:strand:- start:1684 stop:2217 length:534 start_codon:yes stop_codon:yes gene_type:complete